MNSAVVFSGHRNVNLEHAKLIGDAVERACDRASHMFLGGAAGADSLALMTIVGLAVTSTKEIPFVTVIVPSTLEKQPQVAQEVILQARRVLGDRFALVEMGRDYNAETLKARNREMIDRAIALGNPELLCYFTKIWKSGTYSAMHYAGKQGVPITQIVP